MKWLKRKLRDWINNDDAKLISGSCIAQESIGHDYGDPLRFTISKAHGGIIVSTQRYNSKIDRSESDVYIITEDQDLSAEIGKIVTIASLKM